MKIVIIKNEIIKSHNRRINTGFLEKLSKFFEVKSITAYNRKKGKIYKTAKQIEQEENPDAMILHTHGDILDGYLKDVSCMKIMYGVDFYKIIKKNNLDWYRNNKFDLIFQRLNVKQKEFPIVYLPYSADKDFFDLNDNLDKRTKKVCFAGSTNKKVYWQRHEAIKQLEQYNLLNKPRKRVINENYAKFLNTHIMGLTSYEIKSVHAKFFEMVASRNLVLSPKIDSLIFDSNMYTKYKGDCSDIVKVTKKFIKDDDMRKEYVNNAYKHFLENHTDDIRLEEMKVNIENTYYGKQLEHFWS